MQLSPSRRKAIGVAALVLGGAAFVVCFAAAVVDRAWLVATFPDTWRAFMPLGFIGLMWVIVGLRLVSGAPAKPEIKD